MATFLLVWNPKRWNWDDIDEFSEATRNGKGKSIRWSCGNSKQLHRGDRAFFIRLGVDPKGVFASGIITKGTFEDIHWDKDKAELGEIALYVQVELDAFLDPEKDPVLPREVLSSPPFSAMHWDTQMSGVRIPDEIAEQLEQVWRSFNNTLPLLPEEIKNEEVLFEGAKQQIVINAYERNPEARRKCIAFYGTTCSICGFNFLNFYGENGRDLIHVHHLRRLADVGVEYQIDPIKDLRPVCPNCHALIHKRNPQYSIDEMKSFLKRDKPVKE